MIITLHEIYLVYRIEDSKMDRTCSMETINAQNILTLWRWSWAFTVQHNISVNCEYFMNQEG